VEGGSLAPKSREILFPLATNNGWDMGAGVGARMLMCTRGTHLWSLYSRLPRARALCETKEVDMFLVFLRRVSILNFNFRGQACMGSSEGQRAPSSTASFFVPDQMNRTEVELNGRQKVTHHTNKPHRKLIRKQGTGILSTNFSSSTDFIGKFD
jgi:hypothetical protein